MNKKYLTKLSEKLIELCILEFLKEKNKEHRIKLEQISHSERIKAYYINYNFDYENKINTTEILLYYHILESKIDVTVEVDYSIKNIDLVYWMISSSFRKLNEKIDVTWGGQNHIESIIISKNFEICYNLIQAFR